ncbi:MAG: hypothetical protein VR72_13225 [Clostridiaceae bacterium BRH_c20a]|nr:MAG: hypothetical protein VR72_13225 [Clostridiaceae bacterium BRH_c20a]
MQTQFFSNPGVHQFVVPTGVKSLTITAIGAAGGEDIALPYFIRVDALLQFKGIFRLSQERFSRY